MTIDKQEFTLFLESMLEEGVLTQAAYDEIVFYLDISDADLTAE